MVKYNVLFPMINPDGLILSLFFGLKLLNKFVDLNIFPLFFSDTNKKPSLEIVIIKLSKMIEDKLELFYFPNLLNLFFDQLKTIDSYYLI